MSLLKARLTDAMKDAMRAKDKARLSAIRMALAVIKQAEVDTRADVSDEQVVALLDKQVKQREDSVKQYEAANRQDLADVEKAEIVVLREFLPAPLSEAEVDNLIEQAISSTGASSMKDMGQVMAQLKPQLQGRADMGAVSKLIKARLG